jgi:hypothetical protein
MNNLTAKEKAEELVDKMWNIDERYGSIGFHEAKQCAIISLNEKIAYAKTFGDTTESDVEEFDQIKQEIKNYDTRRSI